MSARETDLLLDAFLEGIAAHPKIANPTVIAEVTYAPETDRTTCWIRLAGETRECSVLLPNIRLRKGNKIKVRRDGNGRYEMVGAVSSDDAVSGAFPRPSTDSPFDPVVSPSGPILDPDTGDPIEAGTTILDRRPDNEYDEDGAVVEPTEGRGDPPTPPGGGGGSGSIFQIDLPNAPFQWGVDAQMQRVIDGDDSFAGDIRRVPYINHQHGHGQHPVDRWPSPDEPHFGYAYRLHSHPELSSGGGVPIREFIIVPIGTEKKHFATTYTFHPGTLLVYLNGLLQVPWENVSTDPALWEYKEDQVEPPAKPQGFTFHDDVLVDGTTVDQDVPDVIEVVYWRPVATVTPPDPVDPPPPPAPPGPCISNFVIEQADFNGLVFSFTTDQPVFAHALFDANDWIWQLPFQDNDPIPSTFHRVSWDWSLNPLGGPSWGPDTAEYDKHVKIWLTDESGATVCDDAPRTIHIVRPYVPPPPPDPVAFTISNLAVTAITSRSAHIHWDTNLVANAVVEFGPTTAYESAVGDVSHYTTAHDFTLDYLTPNTTYHYRVHSVDEADGTSVYSEDMTFTTEVAMDFLLTGVAEVGATSARLVAQTTRPGQITVHYGTDANSLGTTINGNTNDETFDETIPLITGRHYYAQFSVRDSEDHDWWDSTILEFTAGGAAGPFTIFNATLSSLTSTSAHFHVETNALACVLLIYSVEGSGPPESSGGRTALGTSHDWTVTGLTPNTNYRWHVRAYDSPTSDNVLGVAGTFSFRTS